MSSGSASATGLTLVGRSQDLILPLAIVASVLVILVPLPAGLMDVLLAANITVAVVVLLTTIYVRTPLEFSVFPTLLLATTLTRLVLNIAITRLILTRAGSDGLDAAGHVVNSFSNFVTGGGNVTVGLIIFAIIIVIQFVVITKGATRISEVAARFALDGMPGKQMAIDADLNSGAIDQQEARQRRTEISQQADFYGAMDGASKFVRGDAIAAVVIIFVNILGGLFIGVVQQGMPISDAASLFTRLTIGDGLVSQVPALLISLAAGLLITRSAQSNNLPKQFLQQLLGRPQALAIAGGFLAMLVFTSLPAIPLLTLGGACFGLAWIATRRQSEETAAANAKTDKPTQPAERIEDYLTVDPIAIELGLDLLKLADPNRGGDLLQHVQQVRHQIASELGFIIPKVRLRDNLELVTNEYRITLFDSPVAQGSIVRERLARGEGVLLVSENLADVCRSHALELLTRDATQELLNQLKTTAPTVVDELVPKQMTLAEVQTVLQLLIKEQVSIRQLGVILETLGNEVSTGKEPTQLAESVRQRLARQISSKYRDTLGEMHVATLDPDWEDRILAGWQQPPLSAKARIAPSEADKLCEAIDAAIERLESVGRPAILLVSPAIRPAVRQLTEHALPQLVVLSYHEVTRDTKIMNLATAGGQFTTADWDHQLLRQAS